MNTLERLCEKLDRAEELNPDPVWNTAGIAEMIVAENIEPEEWPLLIARYGSSHAVAVVAALAACLAGDANRDQPRATLGEVFQLVDLLRIDNASVLQLCLETISRRLSRDPNVQLSSRQADQLMRFLTRCISYSGEGSWVVEISVLGVLERLYESGDLHAVLSQESISPVKQWLIGFKDREKSGPFAESADALLQALM